MSTATLEQETLSLEGANSCQFLVLYENAAAHDAAMEVCGRVAARFEPELAFSFSFWKFKDLSDPAAAHWAADALARADIVLFSLQGRELAPEIANWLETCVPARTKAEGALALIVAGFPDTGRSVEVLVSRMQFAAYRLRMDFLPLVAMSPDAETETSTEPLPAVLNQIREEPVNSHWGLNE